MTIGIANTPEPPYYACIFTSVKHESDDYARMAQWMAELAQEQPGYLGVESVRQPDGNGITVSYWQSVDDLQRWKAHAEHLVAQKIGSERWYADYHVRICQVVKSYGKTGVPV